MVKAKKIASKQNIIYRMALGDKPGKIITSVFIIIITCLLFGAAIYWYVSENDEHNVQRMREDIAVVMKEIKRVDADLVWTDNSFCTVVNPRSFGDTTEHSCTILHQSTKKVANQLQVNSTVDRYQDALKSSDYTEVHSVSVLRYPSYTTNANILAQPGFKKLEQVSVSGFELKSVKSAKCNMHHELINSASENGVEISLEVTCYQKTRKAYFEPIRYI